MQGELLVCYLCLSLTVNWFTVFGRRRSSTGCLKKKCTLS